MDPPLGTGRAHFVIRRRTLRPDSKGYFRPYIGFLCDASGNRTERQPRFNLGKDEQEATFRYTVIQKLYRENCVVVESDCWSPLALSYAREVAKGFTKIEVPPFEWVEDATDRDALATQYVQLLRVHQDWFPSLNLIPSDPVLYYQGVVLNEQIEHAKIKSLYLGLKKDGVVKANKEPPQKLVVGTLHECLDAYIAHIETTAPRLDDRSLKQSHRKRIQWSERNREAFPDCPLSDLDYDRIDELVALWRNRPKRQRGDGRSKPKTVKHQIDEFYRFLRWLDASRKYDWVMPRGLNQISRRATDLPEDLRTSLLQKRIYTPDQLGLLYKCANDLDRLLLLVGLNCAFGAAEIGRLLADEVLLNHHHEYADRLHFKTTLEDSFIRLMRPKTKVFGEWLLWPETAEVLRRAISRARNEGGKYIVCRQGGHPLYNEASSNPQAAIAKRWSALIEKASKDDPRLPVLPYGTLRDTIPDKLRHMGQDTLASMCLAHGTPFKGDSLLDCYGDKPYGRLHDALRHLRDFYSPIFCVAAGT